MAPFVGILYIILFTFSNSIVNSFALELPIVDLGYESHQALVYNESGSFYNFSNIRYGRAPVGDLRWRAPQAPLPNLEYVQKGEVGRICPQAFPSWYAAIRPLQSGNETLENLAKTDPASFIPPPDPRENEDCLFLDVVVPVKIFNHTTTKTKYAGAPVVIWFYGGGFTFTDKDGSPSGLIKRSQERAGYDEGIIYVKFNYRGGAFGFLSGPDVRANGSANVGLLDQRAALQWVQKYIHLFGGDPGRVTAFGQSAGAGSILHQITAYGGLKGATPFQQAILQSPGFQPYPSNFQQGTVFNNFLALINATTLDEARKLPFDILQRANHDMVAASPNGLFTFSPTVDGSFVPNLPGQALATGNYDKSVKVMVGHNSNETLFFVNEDATSDSDFRENLQATFSTIHPSVVEFIAEELYPPVNDTWNLTDVEHFGYWSRFGRRVVSSSDASFVCNAHWTAQAASRLYRNQTYEYIFALQPGFHGQDVPYFFYNGDDSSEVPPVNGTVARWLQTYVTEFVITGKPNREGSSAPLFPGYAEGSAGKTRVMEIHDQGVRIVDDPDQNERCQFWQKALYY